MDRQNIRKNLIGAFLNIVGKRNSMEIITMLAMIGIETVLQNTTEFEPDLQREIQCVKLQLQDIQLRQMPSKLERTAERKQSRPSSLKAQRDVTPKNYHSSQNLLKSQPSDQYNNSSQIYSPDQRAPIKPSISYSIDIRSMKPIEQTITTRVRINPSNVNVQQNTTAKTPKPQFRCDAPRENQIPAQKQISNKPVKTSWNPPPIPVSPVKQHSSPNFLSQNRNRQDSSFPVSSSEKQLRSPTLQSKSSSGAGYYQNNIHAQQVHSHQTKYSQDENVQISYFDPNSPQKVEFGETSANSSQFSRFAPNEEIKEFFHQEFLRHENILRERNHEDQENMKVSNLPAQKISNVFVKGRLGGSKVF